MKTYNVQGSSMSIYRVNFVITSLVIFLSVSSITPMTFQEVDIESDVKAITFDPSRWMQILRSIYPVFNAKPISDWTFMGTHNAVTGYMTDDNALFYGLPLGSFIPECGKNQGLSLGKQLELGVRYFDMRQYFQNPNNPTYELYASLLGYEFGTYCCHEYAVFNHKMADCLHEVASFVKDRAELVILKFANFFDKVTKNDHKRFAAMFEEILGPYLIRPDKTNPNMVPFAELIQKGRIIIFYEDQLRFEVPELLAITHSDKLVVSHWHGRKKDGGQILCQSWPEIKEYYLDVYGPEQDCGCLKVLQLHVQPGVRYTIELVLSAETLQTKAREVEPHIIKLLMSNPHHYKIGVVQVDFFEPHHDKIDFLAATIYYNLMSLVKFPEWKPWPECKPLELESSEDESLDCCCFPWSSFVGKFPRFF